MQKKKYKKRNQIERFQNRQTDFLYIDCNRYAFVNEEWHRFIKLSSPIVFQQELDFINKIFNEVIEVKNLQNNINEE